MTYLYLGIAILSEVAATTFLKLSDGFSKPLPSLVTVVTVMTPGASSWI